MPNRDEEPEVEPIALFGGSVALPVAARQSVARGLTGFEWGVGVPGSVGGAVRMNAGGHGADMEASVVDATVLSVRSGQIARVSAEQLGFYFRGSALSNSHVVLSVRMRTTEQDSVIGTTEINAVVAWRREHQPGGRNAGSVFVNPGAGDESSGALIDSAGLRGFTIGAVSVSEKHANFIQAGEGSTAADIAAVIAIEDSCIKRYNRINNYLYLAKTNRISQVQLIDSIKNTPQFIAYSTTLYMNNSSFKNMQSSGLLSYLEDGELKNALANYYEVNFKSIEPNKSSCTA